MKLIPDRYQNRQANIELLRIITMLMIVTLHFFNHGKIFKLTVPDTLEFFTVWSIEGICIVAVNCYVFISGYFMVNSGFKLKKIVSLWLQVAFYSIGLYIFAVASGYIDFTTKEFVRTLMTIISNKYWFVSSYCFLLIVSPFVNAAIKCLTQKQHYTLILVLISAFCVLPSLYITNVLRFGGGYSFSWFITLYFIGAYIKKYYKNTMSRKKTLILYLIFTAMIPLYRFACRYFCRYSTFEEIYLSYINKSPDKLYQYNSVFVFLSSLFLFLLFLGLKIEKPALKKTVNFISPLTLGVYLIHENASIRTQLWTFLDPGKYCGTSYLLPYMVVVVLAIFVACCAIELLRQKLFDALLTRLRLYARCDKLQEKISVFIDKRLS